MTTDERGAMTTRERREARAERLREWADKREQRAAADSQRASEMASVIPFGQPILVGHYSEGRDRRYRARIGDTMDRAIESSRMAESMTSRATSIEHELDVAIYDDDPDAVERLEARIATLEAQRTAMREANATFRRERKAELKGLSPYDRSLVMPHQAYELSNLGGRITKDRKRLEWIKVRQARAARAEQAEGGVVVQPCRFGYCIVTFAEKPARDVIDALKAAGFRWGGGSWSGVLAELPEEVATDANPQDRRD